MQLTFAVKFLVGCVVIAVGAYFVFQASFPQVHVRFRATVEVEDGPDIHSGTSVIEVVYDLQPDNMVFFGGRDNLVKVIGYAPTVDLGNKRLLFLTFVDPSISRSREVYCPRINIGCLPIAAYGIKLVDFRYSAEGVALQKLDKASGEAREVPFSALPKLMVLKNINDSDTLTKIAPADFASELGPKIQLKRVLLQLTSDPITPPPAIWPGWLKVLPQPHANMFGNAQIG